MKVVNESKGDFVDTMRVAWVIQREFDGGGPATVPENKLLGAKFHRRDEIDGARGENAQQAGKNDRHESRKTQGGQGGDS